MYIQTARKYHDTPVSMAERIFKNEKKITHWWGCGGTGDQASLQLHCWPFSFALGAIITYSWLCVQYFTIMCIWVIFFELIHLGFTAFLEPVAWHLSAVWGPAAQSSWHTMWTMAVLIGPLFSTQLFKNVVHCAAFHFSNDFYNKRDPCLRF